MSNRILIIDDNRAIHADFRKILESKETDSELDELSAFLLPEDADSGCPVVPGANTIGCQKYRVDSAYQGEEAFQLVKVALEQNDPYAVAFVDMRMPPGWDGLETIKRLWSVDPELHVIICTAFSDHSWNEITSNFPNQHRLLVLKKPFDFVEVCQLASAFTQKWNSEQATQTTLHNLEETVEARTSDMRHELEERRRVEEALRASESEFAAIFETASDGIVIVDEDGVIVRCNSAVRKLTDLSTDELIGIDFASLFEESSQMQFREALNGIALTPAQEYELRGPEGKLKPISMSTSEFLVADKRKFTVTLRDMTDQKQMQRELTQAQKLESIGQLAAGIAHEINTPMQCVSGNVEFLRNCYERLFQVLDNYQEYLEGPELSWAERKETMDKLKMECRYTHIRDQAPPAIEEAADAVKKVIEIVRAMKAMSHPGTQEKVMTDVNELIRSATTISRNRWKYAAELALELEPGLPDILALPAELNQVMLNLIVNAADAVLDKVGQDESGQGKIVIRTRQHREGILIDVEDSGTGIPESIKQKIFDPFFTTKEVGKGTGQGLAITYDAVVKKHGGSISLESVLGKGTTFSVWLPLNAAAPQDSKSKSNEIEAELAIAN
jgi:two-component system NtrC family sensor kinase